MHVIQAGADGERRREGYDRRKTLCNRLIPWGAAGIWRKLFEALTPQVVHLRDPVLTNTYHDAPLRQPRKVGQQSHPIGIMRMHHQMHALQMSAAAQSRSRSQQAHAGGQPAARSRSPTTDSGKTSDF